MLGRKNAQVSLFDIANLAPGFTLPPDSIYERMRQLGSRLVKDEHFAEYYSRIGRPSVPPALLSKVLLLMYLEGLSDRQAEDSARYDLRWKHALGLSLEEAGFCHTSLSRFRLRLLTHEATHVLFERVLELARELEIINEEQATRVVDSTPVLGAGAVQNTYALIRQALLQVKKSAGGQLKGKLAPLFAGTDYGSKADIDWSDPEARQEHLNELVAHARGVLEVLEEGEDLSEGERQAGELLAQVTDQDVELDEEGRFHIRRGVAKGRVISVTDPEMRHGRKSKNRCFDGYKFHVSEDPETELITGVAMGWASEHDAERLPQMVDDETEVVIGDGAYGTADMRAKMDAEGIQVVAPQRPAGRKGMFTKADFRIDLNQETCRCPASAEASPVYRRKDGALKRFRFSRADCERCDLKVQCTRSQYRVVNLHPQERYLLEAREFQGTEDFRALYRLRPTVERKIAEMVRHGMRRARYMGMRRVDLQAFFTAAVVNLKRIMCLTLKDPLLEARWRALVVV